MSWVWNEFQLGHTWVKLTSCSFPCLFFCWFLTWDVPLEIRHEVIFGLEVLTLPMSQCSIVLDQDYYQKPPMHRHHRKMGEAERYTLKSFNPSLKATRLVISSLLIFVMAKCNSISYLHPPLTVVRLHKFVHKFMFNNP